MLSRKQVYEPTSGAHVNATAAAESFQQGREFRMHDIELVGRVRAIVQETFVQLGGLADEVPGEAMLIRDGFFCGRRFVGQGLEAVWFIEENEIKFYNGEGAVVQVIHPRGNSSDGRADAA
jgi:hypothetical protein